MPLIKTFHLGTKTRLFSGDSSSISIQDTTEPVDLPADAFRVHALINGGSGSGKSRLGTALARQALKLNIPFFFGDIHGDSAEDIAATVSQNSSQADSPEAANKILKRFHYLEFAPDYAPRLDPLHITEPVVHPELLTNFLRTAEETIVDGMASLFQSATQGSDSFEGMPRLLRNLKGALFGCVRKAPNRRLPLGLVSILLNVEHPFHKAVYAKVQDILPLDVRGDFDALHANRTEKAREQVESALNRIRGFLSGLLRDVFGMTSETANVFDFESVVRKGHSVVANLRETKYLSHLQGVTLARMLVIQFVETIMQLDRDQRPQQFLIFIEEAGEVITEVFMRYLGAVRKYGISLIFLGQDGSTFQRGDYTLLPKLISQCGILVTFNQRFPADSELFAQAMFQKSLDLTPLVHEVERHADPEFVQMEDESVTETTSETQSTAKGTASGKTRSRQSSKTKSRQQGWTENEGFTQADSQTLSSGATQATGQSTPLDPDAASDGLKGSKSLTQSEQNQFATGSSSAHSLTKGRSGGQGEAISDAEGEAESEQQSLQNLLGHTKGTSSGRSKKWVQIARVKRETQETGQLKKGTISEQIKKFQAVLMELPQRHAFVKIVGHEAISIQTLSVPDPFKSPLGLTHAIKKLKQQLFEIHPYLYVPDLSDGAEQQRIRDFLQATEASLIKPTKPKSLPISDEDTDSYLDI